MLQNEVNHPDKLQNNYYLHTFAKLVSSHNGTDKYCHGKLITKSPN